MNQVVRLGQRRSTLKDHLGVTASQREENSQGPANPEILLRDGEIDAAQPGGRFIENVAALVRSQFRELVHVFC
jgi:hypothetical protein